MVLKRKRNLKIDSNSVYSVFLLKDLDPDETEDYLENRDTGMEADEEKEIHLQNIIKGQDSNIPLPVIVEIENISRKMYKEIDLNKNIHWTEDCENIYVEGKEDIKIEKSLEKNIFTHKKIADVNKNKEFIQNNVLDVSSKIDLNQSNFENKKSLIQENTNFLDKDGNYKTISNQEKEIDSKLANELMNIYRNEDKMKLNSENLKIEEKELSVQKDRTYGLNENNEDVKDEKPIELFTNLLASAGENKACLTGKTDDVSNFCLRRVLLRYDKPGFEPYVCFRDRIFHPTFKSRRNEALMIEKITRMGIEFQTILKLCQMYKQKCEIELANVLMTEKIVKLANKMNLNKKQTKKISKLLLDGFITQKNGKNKMNIFAVMQDRDKIQSLRNVKSNSELFLDIKYYEDVMSIINNKDEMNDK